MDFLSHQETAKRRSKILSLLFVITLACLALLTHFLMVLSLNLVNWQGGIAVSKPTSFIAVTIVIVLTVCFVIFLKWMQLRRGGRRLAIAMGGRRLVNTTSDSAERRLSNVVAEMAIASGMPVPAIYVLDNELGINSFSLGHSPADAIIGITHGAIKRLSRDQLQSVIAHEFSHILNGDMALNLRTFVVLHGIDFISVVGRTLLRSITEVSHSHTSASKAFAVKRTSKFRVPFVFFTIGLALIVIGAAGSFFAGLIRAALSRQRAYLADASAVQFTRNPNGVVDALKVIGGCMYGTRLRYVDTESISHMMFDGKQHLLWSWFNTHPSIEQRIVKIEPNWDGEYLAIPADVLDEHLKRKEKQEEQRQAKRKEFQSQVIVGAAVLSQAVKLGDFSGVSNYRELIPESLLALVEEKEGAMAMVFALSLTSEEEVRKDQLLHLKSMISASMYAQLKTIMSSLTFMPKEARMPLLELTFPALRLLTVNQYQTFTRQLLLSMKQHKKIALQDWLIFRLLTHYLNANFDLYKPTETVYKLNAKVTVAYQQVASLLAHYGHTDSGDVEKAFYFGANSMGFYQITLLPEAAVEFDSFQQSVSVLAATEPRTKNRLLTGLRKTIGHDEKLTVEERDIFRTIAAVMDSPVPLGGV